MENPRILIVDDDRLILATLGEGLRQAGYDVVEAASGEAALALCESDPAPDLAILDVRMPGLSGIDVARELRANTTVPFLFLSAYGDLDVVRQAAEEGALGYLVKPVDVPQVIPSVESALERAREIAGLRHSERHLNQALAGGRDTSVAVGLLMERHRFSAQAAFETLRRQARSQRRKVAQVAAELVRAADTLNQFRDPDGPSDSKSET